MAEVAEQNSVIRFAQALKDAGFTSVDEILELTTGLMITNFYDVVQQKFDTDEELKESLQRMDAAHAQVMLALEDIGTPAEAFLTLLIVQREILDVVLNNQHEEIAEDVE